MLLYLAATYKEYAEEYRPNLYEGEGSVEVKDGILESHAEGRVEGRIEGILAFIQSLMASMGLTMDQAMNALGVSEEDRSTCRGLMKNSN